MAGSQKCIVLVLDAGVESSLWFLFTLVSGHVDIYEVSLKKGMVNVFLSSGKYPQQRMLINCFDAFNSKNDIENKAKENPGCF